MNLKKNHLIGLWKGISPVLAVEIIVLRGNYVRTFGQSFSFLKKNFLVNESNILSEKSSTWLSIEEVLFD
jgi:hypothetical protein